MITKAIAITLALAGQPGAAASMQELSQITWRGSFEGFGSYSGLVITDQGAGFVTVSDKGTWARASIERDGDRITGITLEDHGPILDPKGQPVTRYDVDAEGLTRGPDGMLCISFEANHRVWCYTDLKTPALPQPRHPDHASLQNNSSLEALASDGTGALYTLPERSGKLDRPYPVTRLQNGTWTRPFALTRQPPHLVTGAEFGPDGALYLLERDFAGLRGFSTRIRRFQPQSDPVWTGETLLETPLGTLDNMEGIDVWQDAQGRTRITLISDDNNSFLQRTLIVDYVLTN